MAVSFIGGGNQRTRWMVYAFMVINATFNKISVISWLSLLLGKETRVSAENHWPVTHVLFMIYVLGISLVHYKTLT
jgi:hypothetical protein